jgi:acetate kinase
VKSLIPTTDEAPALTVLALNTGSSSLKFGLYRVHSAKAEVLLTGEAEAIGAPVGRFHAEDAHGAPFADEHGPIPGQDEALARVARLLAEANCAKPGAIGHRIVHGGPRLRSHCLIDEPVMRELEAASAFAPLHMPAALSSIRFAQAHFPDVPQAACFDTAFHADMPDVARVLPIDQELQSDGLQRYGFHGLSCESIVLQIGGDLPDRLIIAHLGAGASVTAVRAGRSIDTSMGLTPTGGVMMGARSGDLDPGVLLYLMREKRFDAAMLEDLVDRRSGLLGVSGVSGDMRVLHEASTSTPAARLAIDMFCSSVAKQVAAMITALDGVDTLVFTGGVGENDAVVRAAICARLSWIGVQLDQTRNRSATNPISDGDSRCRLLVLPSREDEEIASHAWTLASLRAEGAPWGIGR